MLAQYLAAEAAVLLGKEARINGLELRREDLQEIRKGRQEWEARALAEQGHRAGVPTLGGLRVRHAQLNGRP